MLARMDLWQANLQMGKISDLHSPCLMVTKGTWLPPTLLSLVSLTLGEAGSQKDFLFLKYVFYIKLYI